LTLELEGQTRTIFTHQLRGDRSHSSLSALSPAVELAAYRITSEAINNVLTHAEGPRCLVTITANGMLAGTVRDDGRSPTSWTPGVGLRSILERAEELGGTAAAGPTKDGWEVCARLPVDGLMPSVRD
jgi:two-component system, NarL family, sensor kinase